MTNKLPNIYIWNGCTAPKPRQAKGKVKVEGDGGVTMAMVAINQFITGKTLCLKLHNNGPDYLVRGSSTKSERDAFNKAVMTLYGMSVRHYKYHSLLSYICR